MLPQKVKDQIGKCYDLKAGEDVCDSQQLREVERQSFVEIAQSGALAVGGHWEVAILLIAAE